MSTGRDIVTASMRVLGVLASGESAASGEATDGLSALNRLMDSWSTEGLLVYAKTRETPVALTPGTGSYTMGTSGTLSGTRPMAILEAVIRDETSSPATEIPVDVLQLSEYAAIPVKDMQATYPNKLFDDGGYPTRTIRLHPVPSAAHKLVVWTARPLTAISTLDTSVSLPPGYERALITNLAIELAPEYGKGVSDALAMAAAESKANIKRANLRPSYLRVDEALTSGGSFNIYTGGYS
jgi:hypothetical protein